MIPRMKKNALLLESVWIWPLKQLCLRVYKILWEKREVDRKAVGSLVLCWKGWTVCVCFFLLLAFIFHNHTHGREMLDIFVHQMLVLVSFVTGLLAFMEFLMRNNVLLELLRTSLILLQGSWFWQVSWASSLPCCILACNFAFIWWGTLILDLRDLCCLEWECGPHGTGCLFEWLSSPGGGVVRAAG